MNKMLSLQAEMVQIKENWPENGLFWVKDLFHIYKTKYIETVALKDVNFQVFKGEFLSVLGPSGSGKSTLLNILSGLLTPSTGRIYFKDYSNSKITNIAKLEFGDLTSFRREHIGYIFQEFKLFEYLTVEQNIQVPLLIHKVELKENQKLISEILKKCEIEHRREYRVEQLSGGEKQRVQVAMAIISRPSIILADEPTGNLDEKNSINIFELLKSISSEYNTTVLIVSHNERVTDYTDRSIHIHNRSIKE